jgi:F-type H+-transporting ATPase subunit epsilon
MAKSGTFHCSVVTPEHVVLDAEAKFVAFPAHDGEVGILQDRAPLLCKVGIGPLRVEGAGSRHLMYVDGGFAQVVDNKLTILTERAKKIEEIDAKAAEKAMVEARSMEITDDTSFEERQKAIKRAQVQLKLKRA